MDFKKDSHILGGLIGLFLPIGVYLLLILIAFAVESLVGIETSSYTDALRLISVAVNLIPMRYYFVKLKSELSGRGILLVTFIYIVVYFWVH